MRIKDRILHAWNAFNNKDIVTDYGFSSSRAPHKNFKPFDTSSYVSSIYNRIAIDVSMTSFKHVRVDRDSEDEETINSKLNDCLSVEANIDQSHIQLIHDIVYSMFDEGVVAVVPVETTISPLKSGGYDIHTLRVGRIVNWFPKHVEVDLYNDEIGQNERIFLDKKHVAIVENPLYAVVNDTNSTLKRLVRKLQQLDNVDDLAASTRLDLMISVPYSIKTKTQRKMAEDRIRDIEEQLAKGKNGIAYIDGSEKMEQLNRPVNSQLSETVDKLTQEFYNQLGLTKSIFDGTAREEELRTYYTRAVDPIVESIISEFTRKFITKTARTQGHKIVYYRDMFKMMPIETIANLGDVFRRNYIASANELRKLVGFKPSNDPRADELFNPNIADNKQIDPEGTQQMGMTEGQKEAEKFFDKRAKDKQEEKIVKSQSHMTNRERKESKKQRRKE